MDSVSKRASRRKSAFSEDEKALAGMRMEGFLEKKNKYGAWQKRYFFTNNRYLNYSKTVEKKPIIGSLNLAEAEAIDFGEKKGEFCISFLNGDIYNMRCDLKSKSGVVFDCERWLKALQERKAFYDSLATYNLVERASMKEASQEPDKVGWLNKKSPAMRGSWQERYVKLYIDTANLHYYKSAKWNAEKCGSVALDNVQWCRAVDESDDCLEFEFLSLQRVFRWRAETHDDMLSWIDYIQSALEAAKLIEEQAAQLSKRANTPSSIRNFDELETEEKRREIVLNYLQSNFEACDGKDIACLAQAVEFALQDLLKLAGDCASQPGRGSRHDVLAFHLVLYHKRIEEEINPFLEEDVLKVTDNGTLYSLIKLIVRYTQELGNFNAKLPPRKRTASSYMSKLGHLSDLLVHGDNGTSKTLESVCQNAASRQMREGFAGTQMHGDGRYYTHSVTDVWESINTTVSLAVDTKSAALQFSVLEGAHNALQIMLKNIAEDTMRQGVHGDRGIEYICAIMNDCTKHIENLDDLQNDMISLQEVQDHIAPAADRTMHILTVCGNVCIYVLSNIVLEDLADLIDGLFTKAWKKGTATIVGTIIATINDYQGDFSHVLVEYYTLKVAEAILSRVVVAYMRKLRCMLNPSKSNRLRGNYITLSVDFLNQFAKDCDRLEMGTNENVQRRRRLSAFAFLDDFKILFGGNAQAIEDLTHKLAAEIPSGDPRVRIAVEQAISSTVKLRSNLKSISKKEFLPNLMNIIDEAVETKAEMGDENQESTNTSLSYSRLDMYKRAYAGQVTREDEDYGAEEIGLDDGFNPFGEDEDGRLWMGHADDDIENERVELLHFMNQEARPVRSGSIDSLPIETKKSQIPEKFLEGYLEKRNDSKIFLKRWFELEQLHDASNDTAILLLSWSKGPGDLRLNSIVIDSDSTVSIHHATEDLVKDEHSGECYLARDYPSVTYLPLTSKSDNVFILQTHERKLRFRAESSLVMLHWSNKIHELLQHSGQRRKSLMERADATEEEEPEPDPEFELSLARANEQAAAGKVRSARKSMFLKKDTLGRANGFTMSPLHQNGRTSPESEPSGAEIFTRVPRKQSLPPGDSRRLSINKAKDNEKNSEQLPGFEPAETKEQVMELNMKEEIRRTNVFVKDEVPSERRRSSVHQKIKSCCSVS